MKGINVKNRLIAKGYSLNEIATLIGISNDELVKLLDESENVPSHILDSISEAIGENIFIPNEPVGNIIEGDNNNVMGNNTNNNDTILKLLSMLEKKDQQIDKLLKLLEKK